MLKYISPPNRGGYREFAAGFHIPADERSEIKLLTPLAVLDPPGGCSRGYSRGTGLI